MAQQILEPPPQRRSRRRTGPSGFPHLAKQLPPDFRSPSAVNGFIYSLAREVTAGRVESRTAAILGYLSQLALQTLPLLRAESEPSGVDRDALVRARSLHFFSALDRPGELPDHPRQVDAPPQGPE